MTELEWTVRREGDVTLVEAVVSRKTAPVAADPALTVTVESLLDGPVWPPRREGVRVAGWSGDRFETAVPAGGRVAVGFASPADPVEPPVEIVDRSRGDVSSADGATPSDVLRALGDPSPPPEAVPEPESHASDRTAGASDS
ncbi:hypothetical protein SAMN06269185_2275 [Natronoarchaeum philippinense]|uniref:Uncharacterized protein n=1 Tax=Natronoarchaeum philippinense TaxID=558529 RepID=A0A285P3W5_NATPI|nr:hypothetical protein [Natronoarchaeum philippinense]SNZ14846.1 hypothetical protein SAMN06269185_2275 [Natronoarchaeum philippinense]